MENSVLRETTPLSSQDCFMLFSRTKDSFNFPLHVHKEYELNFIENGQGAKRVVGDSVEIIDYMELTLIANHNLAHGWFDHNCESKEIREITIQFHGILDQSFLNKNQFLTIKTMFERAAHGVTFTIESIEKVKKRIYSLAKEPDGVHSVLNLLGILYDLSLSPMRELSTNSFIENENDHNSRRIDRAYNYMTENFNKNIKLSDIAELVGMTEAAFSRFIKKRTGRNYIDTLNDIRFGHATRLLIETTHSIAEISFSSGFNNLSNFNRIFKSKKGCSPSKFRENYNRTKFIL